MNSHKKVSFLATGDEIVNGDILNTNGQAMAQQLFSHGIDIGIHLTVSDTQADITEGISYLLKNHDALIITGGLGPTSDDRTRFALAEALQQELVVFDNIWQAIQDRLAYYQLKNQPISNKNQALFPAQAHIIPNARGTAAGCWLEYQDKLIFMLPGPPYECMPMFDSVVLPILLEHHFNRPIIHKKWLLFNISEGEIAEKLDRIAHPLGLTTGYRMTYPYIEFKLHGENQAIIDEFIKQSETIIHSNLINPASIPATQELIEKLKNFTGTLYLNDEATRGHLLKAITTIDTYQKLANQAGSHNVEFILRGIPEYWENQEQGTQSWLSITYQGKEERFTIPFRGHRSIHYAVEFLANELVKRLF